MLPHILSNCRDDPTRPRAGDHEISDPGVSPATPSDYACGVSGDETRSTTRIMTLQRFPQYQLLEPRSATIIHAKNTIAARFCIPFSVLGFWDKHAMICAGAMPHRRDFPATTRI